MATRDKQYVIELARTVNQLFADEFYDPSAEEISQAHFPERALGGEIIEGVRKRLPKIRQVLDEDFDQPVCLVNRVYFSRFRQELPTTEAEARRCLPIGHGMMAVGLHRHIGGDSDLIWTASKGQNLGMGAGRFKKSGDEIVKAVADHRLSEPRAKTLLERGRKLAVLENPKLERKIMEELPEPEE